MICSEIECMNTAADIFEQRDVDDDDKLSQAEFEYIYLIYCPDAEKTIGELYHEYDTDYDGQLTLEEFTLLYCKECKGQVAVACTEEGLDDFALYDGDVNNLISREEFEQIYNFYFDGGNKYHREYLFALYDANKDHNLSLAEFNEFYC